MSQQINLFNPIFMRQRHSFGARGMALALALMLVGVIAMVVFAQWQLVPLRSQSARQASMLQEHQARLAEVSVQFAPRAADPALKGQLEAKDARLKSLQQATQMLRQAEGEGAQGFADYFRAFARQSVSGLWLTEVAVQGEKREVSLHGRVLQAALVPAYLSRLGSEPVLRGKSFQALDMAPAAQPAPVEAVVPPSLPLTTAPGTSGAVQSPPLPETRFLEFRLRSSAAAPAGPSGGQP
ncbi:hypothetical protein SAMN05518865_11525 [Duganella sp. CF458]|uniref:hypothetical protein n=1 Tax=Duganella sp. CF458 TaxID=1884368 RepID=UPI0008F2BF0D|nr:hypothetical protein [Duganella sp. CF458]SFG63488.1 hypothetical protein SAMN05518865_11525 [Duganella sp. CF458]